MKHSPIVQKNQIPAMSVKWQCEQFENFLFTIFPTLKSNKIKPFGEKSQTGCFSVKEQPVQEYLTDSSGILGQINLVLMR